MHTKGHPRNSLFGMNWNPANVTLVIMLTLLFLIFLLLFLTLTAQPAQGQIFTVIHNFTGQWDGAYPSTGLAIDSTDATDSAVTLYGTTQGGDGWGSGGTVFRLKSSPSGRNFTMLYDFSASGDGSGLTSRVLLARDGALYGTTEFGGGSGWGTVFQLIPPNGSPTSVGRWKETVLYGFTGGSDGARPVGDLTLDHAGNIYGTAPSGGSAGNGVIYELTPSDDGWTESVLYSALNNGDGSEPMGGVVFDRSGNLYGDFPQGGPYGYGAVFELSPSGSSWNEQTIYAFPGGAAANPVWGLIFDPYGNLYGGTSPNDSSTGLAFELTPGSDGWIFAVVYSLSFWRPSARLVMDAAGNLYGTTSEGGAYGAGSVFKLTPSNDGWTYTSLHDFCPRVPCADGSFPVGSVVLDAKGNLYGTASGGGTSCGINGCGVVWEITP